MVMFGGCAHDVVTRFPLSAPGQSGAIDVVLNDPTSRLTIAIDDILVVDREHSRHAHIDGVPAGTVRVRVATGGSCEAAAVTERDLIVTPGVTSTLALPGPNGDHGCMVYVGLLGIAFAIEAVGFSAIELEQNRQLASHVK